MSAVPESPSRPERCSRVAASSAGGRPTCSSSQSTSPGSTLPERVAITSPSSGVKPMVVSTDTRRGPRRARRRPPDGRSRPEGPADGRFEHLGGATRGVGVREAVEAVAAQVPAMPPLGRQRIGCGCRGDSGVEGGVEAGDRRHVREQPADQLRPRSDFGWWSGARSVSASRRRAHPASISTGSVNSVPPWTMRWPTASIGRLRAIASRSAPSSSLPAGAGMFSAESGAVAAGEHRELEAARAALTIEDPHSPSDGPGPVADVRRVLSATAGCRRGRGPAGRPSPGGARRRATAAPAPGRPRPSPGGSGPGRSASTMSNGVVVVPSSL